MGLVLSSGPASWDQNADWGLLTGALLAGLAIHSLSRPADQPDTLLIGEGGGLIITFRGVQNTL